MSDSHSWAGMSEMDAIAYWCVDSQSTSIKNYWTGVSGYNEIAHDNGIIV